MRRVGWEGRRAWRGAGASGFFTGRTVAFLGGRLRSGETTSAELVRQALGSIDPELNAFAAVDADRASEAARRADGELAGGTDRGPLHGIPVAVKDNIDVKGLPTGLGTAHVTAAPTPADAACVRLLRDAGAVVIGKTTLHEFAYGVTGDLSVTGPARNPHDVSRMSGGSSSGSAVAVAAGMVPLALGTDTGGSVRIPAALCGIAGFKPAFGAVPVDGVHPLAASLDHVGILARTPADCRTAYRVLAGPQAAGERVAGPVRMAWLESAPLDPEVGHQVREALAHLPALPTVGLDLAPLRETFRVIQNGEVYDLHAERVARAPGLFRPELLDRLRQAARTPAWQYVRALRERERLAGEIAELLHRYEVLALPTVPLTAPTIGEQHTAFGPVQGALQALTIPWNLLGLPALTVPAGSVRGLPVGVQFISRVGAQEALFAAAELVARR